MIRRNLEKEIQKSAQAYPVVIIVGPRQSGKTTISKALFNKHAYVSLEDFSLREEAETDPKKFLATYAMADGIIIDEFQHVPTLLSYIQLQVDENRRRYGYFILTGSQNYLMNQAITQTLAGRAAIITLLPFSIPELKQANLLPDSLERLVFQGCYPEVYINPLAFQANWYANYIRTYIERDVRLLKNIENLNSFVKFMKLCAARVGQVVNYSSLASDADIDVNSVKSWLSILQAGYIIFFLQPFSTKFTRRLIKNPKLFFYDTGLAASLLGLHTFEDIVVSSYRGNLVESLIVADIVKLYNNANKEPRVSFLRDQDGREVGCLLEKPNLYTPLEIKARLAESASLFDTIKFWQQEAKKEDLPMSDGFVIYAGDTQKRTYGTLLSWRDIDNLLPFI